MPVAIADGLQRLLEPGSIAVVGASDKPDSYGDTILRNLERLGYAGELWGVNPGRETIRGIDCVPSLGELPGPVDAVAVAIPAAGVPAVIDEAIALGCGGAVVVSAGFGEVESGRGLEQRLRESALAAGFPVCGPNGNGVVSFPSRAAIWGDSVQAMPAGGVALISQSGNVAVNALGSRRATGFHTVVSTGNQAVCDASDWLAAVSRSEGVRSVALFLESDGDGERFASALADCAERGIGVAVLKVGSSTAGAAAGAAHTGSLAGDQRVFRALIEEAGACWAEDPHELLEIARVLAEPAARPRLPQDGPSGSEVGSGLAIITCSGGDSGLAADQADRLGIPLPAFSEATAHRLRELLPEAATVANPLDYTSMLWADGERLAAIAETAGNDPAIDQLLVFHDTPAELATEVEPGWRRTRHGLADGAAAASAAPLFASTLPDLIGEAEITELAGRGIAAVQGLATAMRCVAALRSAPADPGRLREIAAAAAAVAAADGTPGVRPETGTDAEWAAAAGWLSEAEAKYLLGTGGVAVPDRLVADNPDAATDLAGALGYPVALKLSSPAIQHKSEIGAIALGIDGPAMLREEAARMLALPQATGAELLVERMSVQPGAELIVAVRADAVVPALVIGIGGVWTEVLGDVAVIPLPAGAERIREAIVSLRGAPLLLGARGTEPVDLEAVAAAAARIGEIAVTEGLALLEVNPLIAMAEGCLALDAVARRIA